MRAPCALIMTGKNWKLKCARTAVNVYFKLNATFCATLLDHEKYQLKRNCITSSASFAVLLYSHSHSFIDVLALERIILMKHFSSLFLFSPINKRYIRKMLTHVSNSEPWLISLNYKIYMHIANIFTPLSLSYLWLLLNLLLLLLLMLWFKKFLVCLVLFQFRIVSSIVFVIFFIFFILLLMLVVANEIRA